MDDLPCIRFAAVDLCDTQHHRPRPFVPPHKCLSMLDCDGIGQIAARSPRDDVNLDMSADLAFAKQTGASLEAPPNLLPASSVPSATAEDADVVVVGPAVLDPRRIALD